MFVVSEGHISYIRSLQLLDLLLNVLYSIYQSWLFLQITGIPWTTDYRDRRINVTHLNTLFDVKDPNNPQFIATVQQSLQQGTNCTFYLCYKQIRFDADYFDRISPISCVTGKSLYLYTHTHTHMHTHTHTHTHRHNTHTLYMHTHTAHITHHMHTHAYKCYSHQLVVFC